LNPITSGAGISLKLIRAMSSGIPILSTPLGARGFLEQDQDVVFISELKDLKQALDDFLTDPNLRSRLASNAKELVEKSYNWKSLSKNFNLHVAGNHNSAIKFYEAEEFLSHRVLNWYSSGLFEKNHIDELELNTQGLTSIQFKKFCKTIIPKRFHKKIGSIYSALINSR
jgi:phenylpropionate dioxygenase-like ring-hydroxylating dioxygenase large terminal subunit